MVFCHVRTWFSADRSRLSAERRAESVRARCSSASAARAFASARASWDCAERSCWNAESRKLLAVRRWARYCGQVGLSVCGDPYPADANP